MSHQKSVVKRAIVGTLIAGPVGTIFGGISGVGENTKTENVQILNITYKDTNNVEQTISFMWEYNIDGKQVPLKRWATSFVDNFKRH